ncbi:golgin subfamily A member 6-like protein 24 isoform X2 [Ictalurus punctatus]|uniref:Golgin subfamily A member 6-like protein 24 isoform X2 n=1 Tax=Ictalurus punctatus TaxID=7998 RepID=A0A2D0PPE4_ICTPU|nr:golgin subfamily A member 6-like protein 24 isoform X2 [Ictalurus punctatus]
MEDGNHDGADDTDELLCTEVISDFGVCPPAPPRDHCDLLLDAIDAQLSRLQTCSHGQSNGGNGKKEDILGSASLDRSTSVSKDTGLGTDKASSAPDGLNSEHADLTTVEPSRSGTELVGLQEDEREEHVGLGTTTSWHTGGAGGVGSSKREQCLWRLERLLGTGTGVTSKEEGDEDESVRTEDFSARFLEEMLDPTKPSAAGSAPDFSAPDSASISSDTTLLTEPQVTSSQNADPIPSVLSFKSPSRQLAGVPLKSFDLVAIDSDLDSVCTERVRHHLQSTLTDRIAQEEFLQNGSCDGRTSVKTKQRAKNQTFSSGDEVNSVCVRRYRALRSPVSVQRREKRNQSRRNTSSSSSTASTSNKGKADDKIRSEFSYVELSLAELQQQKVAAVQVVERLRKEVEQAEKEQHTLHLSVTHTRTHTQLLRSELHKLQAQRDLYIQEVRALQESQAALQRHITTVHHDASPHRHVNHGCVSALERQEMDRLLDNAKSELFSEQRRFRHTLDSMQERLEEVTQELEQKLEENRKLREKCSQLEEKLTTVTKTRQELQESVQSERVEQEDRLRALEKIIAQKELLVLETQEEKNRLEMEIGAAREEHSAKLKAALGHAQKQKEVEVEQLRTQMTLTHTEELQRVRIQVHEIKEAALREQAVTHTRHTESLHNRIQMKEEEVNRLQESLKEQQEELRRREEELRGDTQEQVRRAVAREQRRWEEQRAESLREQQVRLEKQMQEVERRGRAEGEREKRSALALQNKVLELQKTVEELDSTVLKQTAVIRALRDEHQTELYKLRRQLQQEAESERVRLKECVRRSEQELQSVRAELAECEHLQQGAAARNEQQKASWAQDIHTECVCLQELLTQNGFTVDNTHLSHSVTVSEAVKALQSLRKSLQHLITSLQDHITSLTHTKQQLSTDKEEELRVLREQLTSEKERAVNALREKLIQEHIEELSSLNRVRLRDDDDGEGVAARLRRQLQAKDEELRQVQRNMVQWKEKTTARLARKFEQELTCELERKACRLKSEPRRRLEQLEGEMRHLTASSSEITAIPASSASSAHVPDTASSHDLDSYKLLRHLQSRIRQLQADTQSHTHTYTPSAARLNRERGNTELAGSYLETIAPALESRVTRQHPDLKTALNPNL